MAPDIDDAIESARTSGAGGDQKRQPYRRGFVIRLVLSVIRELPEDMTMRDLREELED